MPRLVVAAWILIALAALVAVGMVVLLAVAGAAETSPGEPVRTVGDPQAALAATTFLLTVGIVAAGAWTRRPWIMWAGAVVHTAWAGLTVFSIGLYNFVIGAPLLLIAALLVTLEARAGRRSV